MAVSEEGANYEYCARPVLRNGDSAGRSRMKKAARVLVHEPLKGKWGGYGHLQVALTKHAAGSSNLRRSTGRDKLGVAKSADALALETSEHIPFSRRCPCGCKS